MKKRLFLTMMLLSSLLGGSTLTINAAANTEKAVWCRSAKKLYILYDDATYTAGNSYANTGNNTVTGVYSLGTLFTQDGGNVGSTCTTVIINENFRNSGNIYCHFSNFTALTSITGLAYMITESTKYMNSMFTGCSKLTSIDFTGVNTSNVTDMTQMFEGCQMLQSINGLSSFDTGKVISMKRMFYNCKILQSLDLSSFNTGNVASEGMKEMFYGCEKLQTLELSSNFTTSKVTTMEKMFCNCQVLQSLDLSSFTTATVTSMKSMFQYCKALVSLDLSSFDTGEVKDDGMQEMFSSCLALQSLNLGSHFNTSKVTTMKSMFSSCNSLASLDVSSFHTSLVTDMSYMFDHCYLLTSLDLRNFDVSQVTDMSYMFRSNTGLVRIYSNTDWNLNTPTSTDMFVSCNKLEGAIDFTSGYHNATHANPTNGYFTYRYPVTLSFSENSKEAIVGTAFTEPTLTISTTDPSNPELSVTYSSSNEVVATVDASTGKVTPLSSGTINIKATYEGTIHYEPQSASYELTVNAKAFGSKTALCGVGLTSDHINVPGKLETDLGDNLISGSVALTANEDYSVLTLTLTDAKLSTTAANFIYNQWLMNIILVGDNEVSSTRTSAIYNHYGPMTVSGTGKLTISGSYGIYNNGSFIQNGGTLDVAGRQSGLYGSSDNIKYTINDGVLIVTGGSEASICCKQATGQLILGTGVTITQPYGAQWNSDKYAVVDAEGNPIKSKVTIAKGAAACGLAYSKSSETVVYGSTTALPTLTNPHSLPVTYSSSNTAVATVEANGAVTIVKPGTTTITATFDGSATYMGGTASYELTVQKATPVLTFSEATATATYGAAYTGPTLTVTPEGLLSDVTYYSNDNIGNVAIIDDNKVVIKGKGTAKIYARLYLSSNNEYYEGVETYYTLTVSPATATLAFANSSLEGKVGKAVNSPAVTTTPASLTVKYSSSDETKAVVNETTGVVTPLREGTVNITAKVDDGHYYGTTSYQLTISKNAHDLSFDKSEYGAAYGSDFTSPTLNNPHSLVVFYGSSDHSVATVNANGVVTLVGVGETDITAETYGNDTYYAGSTSYHLKVVAAIATLTLAKSSVEGKVGTTINSPAVTTSPASLTVKYSSSDETVATVNENTGVVTALKEGTVTITAKVDDGYHYGTTSYQLTISKNANGLAFSEATATTAYNSSFTPPTLTNPNSLSVTYESSDPTVATVAVDGKVTVLKTGKTTISAKFAGNVTYEAGTVSYVLTIYLKGDANGDNKVNVADIVQMVKAGKSQTEINEVVDIIMSE